MITINVTQGTPEWHKLRLEHFTASEAPAMMGASKYMSRDELLHMKATGEMKPVSAHQQKIFDKGHATEEMARPHVEQHIGEDLYPVTGLLEDTKLLASFDGLTLLEDIVFEHKLWNTTLAGNVANSVLEPHYYWQLEQQLLVSGAEKAIFVTSDGTEQNFEAMEYVSVPERREALSAGWAQFEKDLASYQVTAKTEKVVASDISALPALNIDLVGQVNSSNLAVYQSQAMSFIQGINTNLQTEQDFADAEQVVKFCTAAEKELDAVKEQALSKTADIKALFATIDTLKGEMRDKRLALNKLVKTRKSEIKTNIINQATVELSRHVNELNAQLNGVTIGMPAYNFTTATKNKRTLDSMQSAANDHLAQCKIDADRVFQGVKANLVTLNELAAGYLFLFNDIQQLVSLGAEHFALTVKNRITEQKQAEEQQREQMRLEEERKAKAEAEAQAQALAQQQTPTAPKAVLRSTQVEPVNEPQSDSPECTVEIPDYLFDCDSPAEQVEAMITDVLTHCFGKVDIQAQAKERYLIAMMFKMGYRKREHLAQAS